VIALFGRWHDLARFLEHEAALARDNAIAGEEDAEVLGKAAAILRKRGDVESALQEAERKRRMGARPARR
jgi:hypothetical protein